MRAIYGNFVHVMMRFFSEIFYGDINLPQTELEILIAPACKLAEEIRSGKVNINLS